MAKPVLLLVEDDPGLQTQLRWALDAYQVEVAVEGGKSLRFGATGAERETVLWLSRFLAGRIQRGR